MERYWPWCQISQLISPNQETGPTWKTKKEREWAYLVVREGFGAAALGVGRTGRSDAGRRDGAAAQHVRQHRGALDVLDEQRDHGAQLRLAQRVAQRARPVDVVDGRVRVLCGKRTKQPFSLATWNHTQKKASPTRSGTPPPPQESNLDPFLAGKALELEKYWRTELKALGSCR